MAITVFIADDQAMVRQGFGALLTAQHDISVIGDADNGATAVDEVKRLHPDVAGEERAGEFKRAQEASALQEGRGIRAQTHYDDQ